MCLLKPGLEVIVAWTLLSLGSLVLGESQLPCHAGTAIEAAL